MTLAAISLIAVGCKTINDSILFTIKEGRNNTSGRLFPELINSDCINFEFYIHKSWLCDNESNGWNYLIGLSQSWLNHERNSGRLAWRCKDGKIILAAYFHLNGKVTWIELGEFEPECSYSGSIKFCCDACVINAGSEVVSLNGFNSTKKAYLGAPAVRDPAPHPMYFYFKF